MTPSFKERVTIYGDILKKHHHSFSSFLICLKKKQHYFSSCLTSVLTLMPFKQPSKGSELRRPRILNFAWDFSKNMTSTVYQSFSQIRRSKKLHFFCLISFKFENGIKIRKLIFKVFAFHFLFSVPLPMLL